MSSHFSTPALIGDGSAPGDRLPVARRRTASVTHVLPVTIFTLTLLVCGFAQTPASDQQDRNPSDPAAQRVTDRLRALHQEADALASQEKTILVELRRLEVERQIKVEELAKIDRDVQQNRQKLGETSARAAALRRSIDAQRPDVEARLVQLYKLGRAGEWRLMFEVEDLRSMGRIYRTASAVTQMDRDKVREHQKTLELLDKEQKDLEARAAQMTRLQQQSTRARVALDRAVAARAALVASIDQQRDLNARLTGELEAAQQRLQGSLAQLDSSRPTDAALPLGAFQGALPWPLRGVVSRRFGRQPSLRFGSVMMSKGVEITAAEGQPVRAVHEGTVAYADEFTGYGNLVILEHGERSYSLYGYLETLRVARGDRVTLGAELGASGRNPSGNPALYFELRVDGKAVDPLQWLKRTP